MTEPDISIIIVNWNTKDLLQSCLETIAETTADLDVETIVVDNASRDGSQSMLQQYFPQVHLIANEENVGFARANNQASRASKGRYLLYLNSDAWLQPGSLQAMHSLAENEPRAGLIGAQLRNVDGTFQASHSDFPSLWQEFLILSGLGRLLHHRWFPSHGPEEDKGPQVVDYVEGACMLVCRKAFEEVGGLDESYFMYAEEVDWCYTMRERGWQVWYQPSARVVHLGGGSSKNRRPEREADLYRSRVHFFRKHYGDGAAWFLKWQIYVFTAIKRIIHRPLQLVSGGRYGRPVVSLGYLVSQLKEL